jgi:hypothetical protein
LLHDSLRIGDHLALQLLQLLDSSRDRETLIRELSAFVKANMGGPDTDQVSQDEKESLLRALPEELEQKLAELGKLGLLLA